jgi:hypothetical protein
MDSVPTLPLPITHSRLCNKAPVSALKTTTKTKNVINSVKCLSNEHLFGQNFLSTLWRK